jgi:hypothetical protein
VLGLRKKNCHRQGWHSPSPRGAIPCLMPLYAAFAIFLPPPLTLRTIFDCLPSPPRFQRLVTPFLRLRRHSLCSLASCRCCRSGCPERAPQSRLARLPTRFAPGLKGASREPKAPGDRRYAPNTQSTHLGVLTMWAWCLWCFLSDQ